MTITMDRGELRIPVGIGRNMRCTIAEARKFARDILTACDGVEPAANAEPVGVDEGMLERMCAAYYEAAGKSDPEMLAANGLWRDADERLKGFFRLNMRAVLAELGSLS